MMLAMILAAFDPEAAAARTEGLLGGIMDAIARIAGIIEGTVFNAGLFVGATSMFMILVAIYLHAEHSRKPKT